MPCLFVASNVYTYLASFTKHSWEVKVCTSNGSAHRFYTLLKYTKMTFQLNQETVMIGMVSIRLKKKHILGMLLEVVCVGCGDDGSY